jgi:acetyl esterase/lipase
MSLRLEALNLWLRAVEKPYLARVREPAAARARLERSARRLLRAPREVETEAVRLGALRVVRARRRGTRPKRALLYLHGGAFLMGSPETHLALAARLALAADAEAVLPGYRLAPEHAFPAALEDCPAAYEDALARAPEGVAVAGDSAGGGLVFSLLLDARAAGLPDPRRLVAFSPWCDMTMSGASWRDNARAEAMLPVARACEVVDWRLRGCDPRDPRVSPLFARWDRPPPPTLIQAGRRELLASDAEGMAAALRAAGGVVRMEWTGRTPHAIQLGAPWIPEARAAVGRAAAFLREGWR